MERSIDVRFAKREIMEQIQQGTIKDYEFYLAYFNNEWAAAQKVLELCNDERYFVMSAGASRGRIELDDFLSSYGSINDAMRNGLSLADLGEHFEIMSSLGFSVSSINSLEKKAPGACFQIAKYLKSGKTADETLKIAKGIAINDIIALLDLKKVVGYLPWLTIKDNNHLYGINVLRDKGLSNEEVRLLRRDVSRATIDTLTRCDMIDDDDYILNLKKIIELDDTYIDFDIELGIRFLMKHEAQIIIRYYQIKNE